MYRCKLCGGDMELFDDVLVCKSCGTSVDLEDYEEAWDELFAYGAPKRENKPEYCGICGGPYPDCMTSCKLFDD